MTCTLEAPMQEVEVGRQEAVPVTRVVVQQRQRLFREGISELMAIEGDVEVVATATTGVEVLAACQEHQPAVVVIEADAAEWDALRLVSVLRRALPGLAVIGLRATPATAQDVARGRRAGMSAVVSRDAGIAGILSALRDATNGNPSRSVQPFGRTLPTSEPAPLTLTGRELEILGLVGAGMTSNGIASRLLISHKTVENHKQRVFAKLGVQNQAHAVSVALRTGLLRPERVIDLAVGD